MYDLTTILNFVTSRDPATIAEPNGVVPCRYVVLGSDE